MRALRPALVAGLAVGWCGLTSYYVLLSGKPRVLFEPVLRGVALAARTTAGLELSFARASGALAEGELVLEDAHVRWVQSGTLGFGKDRKGDCDLTFERLELKLGKDMAAMVLRDSKVGGALVRGGGPERPLPPQTLARRLDSVDAADEVVIEHVGLHGVRGVWTQRVRSPGAQGGGVPAQSLTHGVHRDSAAQLDDQEPGSEPRGERGGGRRLAARATARVSRH